MNLDGVVKELTLEQLVDDYDWSEVFGEGNRASHDVHVAWNAAASDDASVC
jgi:hypothetical protein